MNPMVIRIIVGVITIILTLIVIALLDGREVQSKVEQVCVDPTERETIRELALSGVDEGYKKHVSQLFDIWVKDPHDQPARAKVGMTNGINAYVRARRDSLAWAPVHC